MSMMWVLVLIYGFGLMSKRLLNPLNHCIFFRPFLRPLYSLLLLWSIFVLPERRREHLIRLYGVSLSFGEWCCPMINHGTVMVSFDEIFRVHLLHGFIFPPENSTNGRLLITENRRSLEHH